MATRTIMSEVLQPFVQNNDTVMVGSADLISSTQVSNKNAIAFSYNTREGNNINYGVREFAMCCINNGITIHGGCRSIDSTFLAFSDYCKSAIRLAGISHIPAINIFSHDTITVGEDGPTHQPIEQIPSLRLIPNNYVFRPTNKTECIVALNHAINVLDGPTTIITSRGNFKQYDSLFEEAKYGGYVFKNIDNHDINIIATGSEIARAMEVSELLSQHDIKARIISMHCVKLFESQGQNYKDAILDGKPCVSIEFASTAP
jgi:transketolase